MCREALTCGLNFNTSCFFYEPLFLHPYTKHAAPDHCGGLSHLLCCLSLLWLPYILTVGHRALRTSFTHVAVITTWQSPHLSGSHLHLCWSKHGQKSISVKSPTLHITWEKQQTDSPKHWNSNSVDNSQYDQGTVTLTNSLSPFFTSRDH